MNVHTPLERDTRQKLLRKKHHEVVIIGAGMSGMYQLHLLLDAGFDAVAIDKNADVGGTWFNNRYPGCRFDSESYTYGYSFNESILNDWDWKEMFSAQPDNYEYTQFVAERLELRPHILLDLKLLSATFDESKNIWILKFDDGTIKTCQYLITALGALSVPTYPRLDGRESFQGPSFHTFDWPHDPLDLKGKKVGVIGTGATGVQVIQTIASEVDELYVFQRRPNWCAPLNNRKVSADDMEQIRARYPEIFQRCLVSPGGFEHEPDRRGFFDLSRQERLELWDRLYDEPGFTILTSNFVDIWIDEDANAELSEYIADRIRGRVSDPDTAEALIPTDHGFGVQRVPLETQYYEAYNRDNVHLVQLLKEPIKRVSSDGIETSERKIDLDIIVYATGFDAGIGPFNQIEIRGKNGLLLSDKWNEGPITMMGMLTSGFPNLLHPVGPQSGGSAINFPRAIEMCSEWAAEFLIYMREHDFCEFDAQPEQEEFWYKEASRAQQRLLIRKAMNYSRGINHNIEGRDQPFERPLGYVGGNPKYRKFLTDCAEDGYAGIDLK